MITNNSDYIIDSYELEEVASDFGEFRFLENFEKSLKTQILNKIITKFLIIYLKWK